MHAGIRKMQRHFLYEEQNPSTEIQQNDENYQTMVNALSEMTGAVVNIVSFTLNNSEKNIKIDISVNDKRFLYLYNNGEYGCYASTNEPFLITHELINLYSDLYKVYDSKFKEICSKLLSK